MKALNEEIKSGQLKKVYLLYGEEAYLKKMYKERLRKAALPEGDTMNYAYYEGKNVNVKEVIDLSETLPFQEIPDRMSPGFLLYNPPDRWLRS